MYMFIIIKAIILQWMQPSLLLTCTYKDIISSYKQQGDGGGKWYTYWFIYLPLSLHDALLLPFTTWPTVGYTFSLVLIKVVFMHGTLTILIIKYFSTKYIFF